MSTIDTDIIRGRARSHSFILEDEDDIDEFSEMCSESTDTDPAPRRITSKRSGLPPATLRVLNDLPRTTEARPVGYDPATLIPSLHKSSSERLITDEEKELEEEEGRMIASKKSKEETYDRLVKLIVLGDTSVGKTSILQRFCKNRFESSQLPTSGVDYQNKFIKIHGKKIKIQVWDTSGQERFHLITRSLYGGCDGIVLLFDVTSKGKESLANVSYWIDNIQPNTNSNTELILVGNKIDLKKMRTTDRADGEAAAKEYSVKYFETSAKTGEGINECFEAIVEDILTKNPSEAPQPIVAGVPRKTTSLLADEEKQCTIV